MTTPLQSNPWSLALIGFLLLILIGVIVFACTMKDEEEADQAQAELTAEKAREGKQD